MTLALNQKSQGSLVEKLDEKRRELGMSDRAFARHLDVSTTNWWNIKQGEREMGRSFLGRVLSEFPELETCVIAYLRQSDDARGSATA